MPSSVQVDRIASLTGYPELAQSRGLDARAQMRRVGLSMRSLADPETPVSADAVRQLLETSAIASGAEDFGLRLASHRSLATLGPISLVLKEEPTARQALDTLCRYLRLLNASLVTRVEDHGDTVVIREEILASPTTSLRQAVELAIGVMYRILRELMGPAWQPLRVCFMHRPPQDTSGHRRHFGSPVDFNAEFNGVVCAASDLAAPLSGSNPEMARFARQHLDHALARQLNNTRDTVRQLVVALLPGGRCTAQQVAQHLGMDRRTLHRHLAADGETFSGVLQSVRAELVVRQVRDSDLPLSEIAALMGFGSPSAFAHWFRVSHGCSVSQWCRTQGWRAGPRPPHGMK